MRKNLEHFLFYYRISLLSETGEIIDELEYAKLSFNGAYNKLENLIMNLTLDQSIIVAKINREEESDIILNITSTMNGNNIELLKHYEFDDKLNELINKNGNKQYS